MMNSTDLGKKIQQLRKQRGLSQEELATQITVSRQAISKWELGETMPDIDNVVQLTKIFGVSSDYLLIDDYENESNSPIETPGKKTDTLEQNFHFGYVVSLVFNFIFLVVETLAWYDFNEISFFAVGVIGHVASITAFELIYYYNQNASKSLNKRLKYYMISIWMVLFIPIRILVPSVLTNWITLEYIREVIFSYTLYITTSLVVTLVLYRKGRHLN